MSDIKNCQIEILIKSDHLDSKISDIVDVIVTSLRLQFNLEIIEDEQRLRRSIGQNLKSQKLILFIDE